MTLGIVNSHLLLLKVSIQRGQEYQSVDVTEVSHKLSLRHSIVTPSHLLVLVWTYQISSVHLVVRWCWSTKRDNVALSPSLSISLHTHTHTHILVRLVSLDSINNNRNHTFSVRKLCESDDIFTDWDVRIAYRLNSCRARKSKSIKVFELAYE